MPITNTTLQAAVSKTAAFAGAWVDVSGITGDFTVKLRVNTLSAGQNARFVIEESPDSGTTTLESGLGITLGGALPLEGVTVSWRKREFGALTKFGVTNGRARVNLVAIDGGTVNYQSWIES